MEIRVQKLMAQANIASRRGAETLIEQGRVRINGEVAKLGDKADPQKDVVEVDGERIRFETQRLIYLALYKPKNVLSTSEPHPGDDRRTVLDLVPDLGHLFTVGRLDADSEGLTVLTNDGGLTQKLTHPSNRHSKEYRVTVAGLPDEETLEAWRRGVWLGEDGRTAPCFVEVVHGARDQSVLRVIMVEGKKRQIRRVAASLGFPVIRLVRTHIGAFSVEGLKPGEYREMTAEEVNSLSFRAPETHNLRLRRLPKADDDYVKTPERPPEEGDTPRKPRPERAPNDLQRTRRGTDQSDDKIDAQIARAAVAASRPHGESSDRSPRREYGDRPQRSYGDRPPRREYGDRGPRREGDSRPPRRDYGDRPPRRVGDDRPPRRYGDRPPRREGDSRPPRREGDSRPPRREYGDRPPRREGDSRPPRREYGDRPPRREYGDRPPRREGDSRPPRREYGDRPPRREGDSRPPRREYGDRPPRREGDSRPPRREYGDRGPRREGDSRPPRREYGDRPQGDRPQRSYGDRPPRRDGDSRPPRGSYSGRPSSRPGTGSGRPPRRYNDRPPRPADDRPPRRDSNDRPPRKKDEESGE
ncbi:MAG: pseudouridine synthase [Anaerolineae bacterium]